MGVVKAAETIAISTKLEIKARQTPEMLKFDWSKTE
jgi:hypothetical protein